LTGVNPKTLSNEELMGRIAQGDERSFEILVHRLQRRILNLIYRFIGDRVLAEDVAQEVFLRVWRAAKDYKSGAKFTTWVYRIATNLCLDTLKSVYHKQSFVYRDNSGEITDETNEHHSSASNSPQSPEDILLAAEESRRIFNALLELPTNQRLAVILNRFDGLSYDEISGVLGCSISAVESLLVRAKKNLRGKLPR
jgi:RNA polymerase sigma-70 factor, ECF subfamily